MRTQTDTRSPWRKRLWFDDAEFDGMMDTLRHRSRITRHVHGQGIDVDVIIEEGLQADLDYVPLAAGILGQTRFYADGKIRIELSRELAERAEYDTVARRRLRSTMAHECGHVVCHRSLHIGDTETLSLFAESDAGKGAPDPIMCRDERIEGRYQGEWWEYQANQCMVALLLPRTLFRESTTEILRRRQVSTFADLIRAGNAIGAIRDLADEYDVSQTLVHYRLEAQGFIPSGLQLGLKFDD